MRRKVRTIFTLLSIFVAFVLFGFLMAVRARVQHGRRPRRRRPADGAQQDLADHAAARELHASKIQAIEGVKDVTHANWFGGNYQETKNQFANMAVDPESWLRMYPEFVVPEDQKKAWLADRQGAIVGADLAKRFGWKVGDRVPLQATIYRTPGRRRRGSSTSSASTIAGQGHRQDAVLLPLRLPERGGPQHRLRQTRSAGT